MISLTLTRRDTGEVGIFKNFRELIIGRDPTTAFRIDLPVVSRLHGRVVYTGGLLYYQDLGSRNGSSLLSVPIQSLPLVNMDLLTLSDVDVLFQFNWPKATFPLFEFLNTRWAGRVVFVADALPEWNIGRAEENLLQMPFDNVSRQHARLIYHTESRCFILKDLGSRNGTFLNQRRIADSMPVQAGDLLTLGDVTLRFLFTHHLLPIAEDFFPKPTPVKPPPDNRHSTKFNPRIKGGL